MIKQFPAEIVLGNGPTSLRGRESTQKTASKGMIVKSVSEFVVMTNSETKLTSANESMLLYQMVRPQTTHLMIFPSNVHHICLKFDLFK